MSPMQDLLACRSLFFFLMRVVDDRGGLQHHHWITSFLREWLRISISSTIHPKISIIWTLGLFSWTHFHRDKMVSHYSYFKVGGEGWVNMEIHGKGNFPLKDTKSKNGVPTQKDHEQYFIPFFNISTPTHKAYQPHINDQRGWKRSERITTRKNDNTQIDIV